MLSIPNPFSLEFGTIIGEGFIGRHAALERLSSRVINGAPGNVSIVGMCGIGKSSLAYQGIIQRRDELIEKRVLPIWITFSLYDTPTEFFRSLVIECYRELLTVEWVTPIITAAYQDVETSSLSGVPRNTFIPDLLRSLVRKFFQQVRHHKIRPLFVMDEFDHASHLFQGSPTNFQKLRDLHTNVSNRVSFVTTSCLPIRDIECTNGISTLAGIFEPYDLGVFGHTDLREYFAQFSASGIDLTEAQKSRIIFYCGGHPLLLIHLGHEIVEIYRRSHAVDIDTAAYEKQTLFSVQYASIIERLRKDGHYDDLIHALNDHSSPSSAIPRSLRAVEITNHLMKQGLLQNGPIPRSLSEHFQAHLSVHQRLASHNASVTPPSVTKQADPPLLLPHELRRELREFIDQRFGLTDIHTICFDLGIDFENLGGGGKKIEALIDHMDRRRRLKELLVRLRDDRPEFFAASGLAQLLAPETARFSASPLPVIHAGQVLVPGACLSTSNRYRITEVLSTPGVSNSVVYKAWDHYPGRAVVIKEPTFFYDSVRLDAATRERLVQRYQRDVHALGTLQHERIARILDFVEERYIVQEWVEGKSLRAILNQGKLLDVNMLLTATHEICEAMAYAYTQSGMVPRDLKPEDIFWLPDQHICIIDFGLAQPIDIAISGTQLLTTGDASVGGTPLSMPPEGSRPGTMDQRADIFSLGVILYECLTGRMPYSREVWSSYHYAKDQLPLAPSISAIRPDVPEHLDRAIRRALAPRPEERFSSWESFAQALDESQPGFV
jgi:tRNA A-37 threonylcarbamoyl transferase component Bud32